MNRILKIAIASTLVLASVSGAALAKGGHGGGHGGGHSASHDTGRHGFASHVSMPGDGSGGDVPRYLINGNEGDMAR